MFYQHPIILAYSSLMCFFSYDSTCNEFFISFTYQNIFGACNFKPSARLAFFFPKAHPMYSNGGQRYLDRHRKNENWADYNTAGFYAKNLLWNKKTLSESVKDTNTRFKNLKIKLITGQISMFVEVNNLSLLFKVKDI